MRRSLLLLFFRWSTRSSRSRVRYRRTSLTSQWTSLSRRSTPPMKSAANPSTSSSTHRYETDLCIREEGVCGDLTLVFYLRLCMRCPFWPLHSCATRLSCPCTRSSKSEYDFNASIYKCRDFNLAIQTNSFSAFLSAVVPEERCRTLQMSRSWACLSCICWLLCLDIWPSTVSKTRHPNALRHLL